MFINRRSIGLALGMAAAVALTAGALIASTEQGQAQVDTVPVPENVTPKASDDKEET